MDYFHLIYSASIISNTISIGFILVTLVVIQEQLLHRRPILSTFHDKLVLILILISFFQSLSNIYLPTSAESCYVWLMIDYTFLQLSVLTFLWICLLLLIVAVDEPAYPKLTRFGWVGYLLAIVVSVS